MKLPARTPRVSAGNPKQLLGLPLMAQLLPSHKLVSRMRIGAPNLKRVAGVERRAAADVEREVERALVQLRALRRVARPRIPGRGRTA